jgi:hypothetical protein
MKKLILSWLLFYSLFTYSQDYKFGAGFANGIFFKVNGTLKITDKQVIFETVENDKKTVFEYEVIKKVNSLLYFTDGVMKHYFTFTNESGTKKGFDYDTVIVFNFDKSQSSIPVTYYCKIEQ